MNAPLLPLAVAFMVGLVAAWQNPGSAGWFVAGGLASLATAVAQRRNERWSSYALIALGISLGALRMAVWAAHPLQQLEAALPEEPQPIRVHGVVLDDPVELVEPRELGTQTCTIELRHALSAGIWRLVTGRVRATVTQPDVRLAYGDEVVVEGQWHRVPSPGNPGQYDWRSALARRRVHGLLRVKPFDGFVILRHDASSPWMAAIGELRRRWQRTIQEACSEEHAGLLRSLLLGQRVALDERLEQAFVETGTIHLLVISGFNVGLIAGLLELLGRLLGVPWRLRLPLLAVALGGYCALTGLQPPVVRATLMAWIVLGALALDRVVSWPNALAAAALGILWVNPTQLFDPSFQLSFGAVLSLLAFASRGSAWLESRLRWLHPGWLRRYVALSMSTTSAVWVGLFPIIAWYFHLVSPISLLANLLIAPLMSALISVGTALLLASTVLASAMRWGSGLLDLLLKGTCWSVSWCCTLPGAYWFVGRPSSWVLFGYYGLLGLSGLSGRLGWAPSRTILCWLIGVAVWVWSSVGTHVMASRWLRLDILDVGHGDSIVIRTPRGQTVLVDAGSHDAGRYRVIPFLRVLGVSTLDALILTHPDEDHIGGGIPLLQTLRVKRLLTNGVSDDTMSARSIRRLATTQHVGQATLAAGMRINDGQDLELTVLHPPRGLVPEASPASNDNSVVLRVRKGRVSCLLTADIEETGLPWLLRAGKTLGSTVLKVPHHGSRLGLFGPSFFAAVKPQVAILSVGRVHRLPAPETLSALRQTGAQLFSTRDDGAIQLRTDGRRLEIRTFRTRHRLVVIP